MLLIGFDLLLFTGLGFLIGYNIHSIISKIQYIEEIRSEHHTDCLDVIPIVRGILLENINKTDCLKN